MTEPTLGYLNSRFRTRPNGAGVKRYAEELAETGLFVEIEPSRLWRSNIMSTIWEQTILVWKSRGQPLISPANAGPVLKRRQLLIVHDGFTMTNPEWFSRSYRMKQCLVMRQTARSAKRVATVSETRRKVLEQTLDREVYIVPNAPLPLAVPSETPERLADLDRTPFVFMLGSQDPRKGFEFADRVWRPLIQERTGVSLVHAGGSSPVFKQAPATIPSSTHSLGRASVAEVSWLLAHAVALLLPSLDEGFGRPAIEAQLLGTPVVASDIPVMRETCGEAAMYFELGSAEGLANAFDPLINNPEFRSKLILAGKRNALRWDRERQVLQLQVALDGL